MRFLISCSICLNLLFVPAIGSAESVQSAVKKGNEFFKKEQFDAALEKYNSVLNKKPDLAVADFNAGSALYKNGKYSEAIEHFEKSLLGDDEKLKQRTYYNLGNSHFKLGQSKEDSDLEGAIQSLQKSVEHFEKAVSRNQSDEDSTFNLEIAKKELKKLQEKKKQQQNNQQKSNQNQQNKEQTKGQDQQQNQGQDQQKSEDPSAPPSPEKNKEQQDKESGSKENPEDRQEAEQTEKQAGKEPEEQAKQNEQGQHDQPGQEHPEQKSPDQNQKPGAGKIKAGELTKEEAKTLLEHYEQNDEPKGLLYFGRPKSEGNPVKDW